MLFNHQQSDKLPPSIDYQIAKTNCILKDECVAFTIMAILMHAGVDDAKRWEQEWHYWAPKSFFGFWVKVDSTNVDSLFSFISVGAHFIKVHWVSTTLNMHPQWIIRHKCRS